MRDRPSPGRWGRWQDKGAQARQRAQVLRVELIRELGAQCVQCGETRLRLLEIDHKEGRTWSPRQTSQRQRVRLYWREAREGKLQVLCRSCNATKGCLVEKPAVAQRRAQGGVTAPQGDEVPSWITETFGGIETELEPF